MYEAFTFFKYSHIRQFIEQKLNFYHASWAKYEKSLV